jgi:hypothetical protein
VVAFQEGDLWVARGVEYDIAAHASALTRLPLAFERAPRANLCINAELGRDGLDGIPPAPSRFRALFESGMDLEPRRAVESAERSRVEIGGLRVAEARAL